MDLKKKLKRIGALVLAIMMMLSGMSFAYAEELPDIQETPDDSDENTNKQEFQFDADASATNDSIEALSLEEPLMESENEISLMDPDEYLQSDLEEEYPIEMEMNEDISTEQKTVEDEIPFAIDEDDAYDPEYKQESEITDSLDEVETDATENNDTEPITDQSETADASGYGLHYVIDQYGYAYAQCHKNVAVYSDKALKNTIYTTDNNRNIWLITAYTDSRLLKVYGIDCNGSVICGYVKASDLDDMPLSEDDVSHLADDNPCDTKSIDIGQMLLFVITGDWNKEKEQEESASIEETILQDEEQEPVLPETSVLEPVIDEEEHQDPLADESVAVINEESTDTLQDESVSEELVADLPLPENEEPEFNEEDESFVKDIESPVEEYVFDEESDSAESVEETSEDLLIETVDETVFLEEETILEEDPVGESVVIEEKTANIGDYVLVTTSTRAYSNVDSTAFLNGFTKFLEGSFLKNAVVQIDNVETDENGNIWYRITYQYGDTFTDGSRKWKANGSMYVLAEETVATDETGLTMTDYAYTKEQMQLRNGSGRKLMATSPMNGFSLKNIKVDLGSFKAGQSGLRGSSGKDSDYPQLAKSASHGTIYATPHYLSGYTVYCLEHTYDGPGEGSGSNQSPTGPYTLIDLNAYCNTTAGAGVSKIQYKESTMHAIGWVLRHTYPYMVLDRSDANNKVWSRVAGQFAIREVIKQLEGSKYVRDYWNMNDFYSFSGGAPAIYLTYAKWLASNGIARAKITGEITVKNQSMSVSGSNYIGKATLTTDADLIRIPLSVGPLTGNSGGKDSNYYYIKSGDTISVTSLNNKFSVPMESISSSDEEAGFLIGIPSASIQKVLIPIEPEPYPMKSKTITFELTFGEITVTKKATDGTVLKGAVFELLSGSNVIATATTDVSGKAKFASITPGTYTIREKTAPQGYQLGSANTQSITVTAGVTTTATFTNAPITKKIRIVKTDSITGKGLPGATFTVTRLSGPDSMTAADIGKVVATITTNASGIAETGELPYGEYRVVETGIPEGYLDSGYSVTQWIK